MAASGDDLLRLLMSTFADEAKEQLQAINQNLLDLEKASPDEKQSLLEEIFREAHSLKGAARAVDLGPVEALGHSLESLFGRIQKGELEPDATVFDVAYEALDVVGSLVATAAAGDTPDVDVSELAAKVEAVGSSAAAPEAPTAEPAPAGAAEQPAEPVAAARPAAEAPVPEPAAEASASPTPQSKPERAVPAGGAQRQQTDETVRVATSKLDSLMAQVGELLAARIGAEQRVTETRALLERVVELEASWGKLRPQLRRALASDEPSAGAAKANGLGMPQGVSRESTLFPVLEESDRRLGELRQQVIELRRKCESDSRRMSQVTTDLQDDVRRTRMLAVSTVFDTFPRMVRDLARELGKQIQIEIEGGDTEVDRSVLEQLKSPLTHMIRNSADHGLEGPDARTAAGKSAEGTITLRASQGGSNLMIEVCDDGYGIDVERVRASAVKKGLLTPESADALSEREAMWLIFRPGFSTNTTVTDVSGRGVGMDVVRESVEKMHGMIDVDSRRGEGTTFSFSLPLSVATTRCLLVRAADQTFALPITNVDRIVSLSPDDVGQTEGQEAIRVDGRPMALTRLSGVLGLSADGGDTKLDAGRPAIVLGSAERKVAFLIDGLLGAQEIAIKRLPHPMVRVRHVAGATILGTGEVVAILNVPDLLRATGRGGPSRLPLAEAASGNGKGAGESTVLVADDSMTIRTLNKNILEAAGYQVKVASDGAEAWTMLQNNAYDIVVSDVEMPNMNGRQLTEKVRGDERLRHLPVVLVTSLDSKEDRERGIAAGADAYIVKGAFDQDQLLQTVERLV